MEDISEDEISAHFDYKKQLIGDSLKRANSELMLMVPETDTIVMASESSKAVGTFRYGPFNENGLMQRPFQLGYFELINRDTDDLPRAISMVNAVGRTSTDRSFRANRVYEVLLENQEIIYVLLLSPEQFRNLKDDGWKISLLEVIEISKEEFVSASENGISELLMKYG